MSEEIKHTFTDRLWDIFAGFIFGIAVMRLGWLDWLWVPFK